ncbi:MAG: 1-acyl-sn-glycerol-3-phosphate acyltransferase [Clostridia bacterium]|nr:1-acyl-sn-glycerol-3-phosphate acyltransferase [Clostridia bacterium]
MHFDYNRKDDRGLYKIALPLIKAYADVHFSISCYGKENIPEEKGKLIIACNHISFADPAVIISHFPYSIHFIAKSELFENPVTAFFLSNLNAFPVRRGLSDRDALKYACKILDDNKILGIFPEGRRVRSAVPEKAKRGVAFIARRTGADVLPVSLYLDPKEDVFRPKLTLRFGRVLKNSELFDGKNDKSEELQLASEKIMNTIEKLWEKKHGNSCG